MPALLAAVDHLHGRVEFRGVGRRVGLWPHILFGGLTADPLVDRGLLGRQGWIPPGAVAAASQQEKKGDKPETFQHDGRYVIDLGSYIATLGIRPATAILLQGYRAAGTE